jgi:Zn-dependent M28 family amino/carboxypeptidase
VDGDSIYNGAVDNAGGVAGVLAAARAFTALPSRPARSVIFLAVTAEEEGLLGSDYFVRNPTVPGDAIVANINIDGLPLFYDFRDVVALGVEHSTLKAAADRAARALKLQVTPDPYPEQVFFIRSDQYSFIKRGVPAIFPMEGPKAANPGIDGAKTFTQWIATRYHKPSDDARQPLDFEAGVKGAKYSFLLGYFIATDPARPVWNRGDFFGDLFGSAREASSDTR